MSVSTLTIPTPESCSICRLVTHIHPEYRLYCIMAGDVSTYANICHPSCLLEIKPEGLRWVKTNVAEGIDYMRCDKCHMCNSWASPHCPSCGVKLLPPEGSK